MASYSNVTNTLNFSVSFKPTSAFPLDSRSMFGSYEAAVAAAATAVNAGSSDSIYYIGQQLTVFENDVVSTYLIQADKTLKAVGAEVIPDNKSVVIGDAGAVSLKDFGVQYYKYIAEDNILTDPEATYPDGMPESAAEGDYIQVSGTWYKYSDGAWAVAESNPVEVAYYQLTTGWKSGLEPKVVMTDDSTYELAWYEPSLNTVEGVMSQVETIKSDIESLTNQVTSNNEALGGRVTSLESNMTTLKGGAEVEGSVLNTVSNAINTLINNPDAAMNSIQELVNWCNEHAEDALQLSNTTSANATAIAAINQLLGTELPGTTEAATVIQYIASVDAKFDSLGSAAYSDTGDFATAAQGSKADTAVQSVTKGTNNGHILVDGTDVEVYTPANATVDAAGVVRVDGSSITSVNGVISVAAVDHTKVTGLSTQLENTKTAATDAAKEYADDTFIPKENITTSVEVAGGVEAASDANVISEKAFFDALTWKTEM